MHLCQDISAMIKRMPLFVKILLGMLFGVILGLLAIKMSFVDFTIDWISPWGKIFMNLLKLIAVPLIFVSLIKGISGLTDISKLSKIGTKTITLYIISTVIAITVGLLLVNTFNPGKVFPEDVKADMLRKYEENIKVSQENAEMQKDTGPLQFAVDLVPENIFLAASDNKKMLQVIFFALLFGIAMILLPAKNVETVKKFFDGFNDIILKIIDLIMRFAPIGVFALMAGIIVDVAGDDLSKTLVLFIALAKYSGVVILGLLIMIFVVYPTLLMIFTDVKYRDFYKSIIKAQTVAFSTSSSAATLPVTMECCENNLGIKKEVTSFVLPIGATINMDGTSLYQAVAAVFIAQAFGMDLTVGQQLTIVLTATLASIGSAAVPGAGIVMLIIVLEAIGVPSEGIALIFAVDRPLDMLRTSVNVTGDSTIASIIGRPKTSPKLIPATIKVFTRNKRS